MRISGPRCLLAPAEGTVGQCQQDRKALILLVHSSKFTIPGPPRLAGQSIHITVFCDVFQEYPAYPKRGLFINSQSQNWELPAMRSFVPNTHASCPGPVRQG